MRDNGHLVNFRNNMINGNKKDCREIIREYGETDFFFDYAQYLESLHQLNQNSAWTILDELGQALANFKYIK
jgi:EAL domain-containing protein (putative c-di-GMP-specific phosphodiesterase class I)